MCLFISFFVSLSLSAYFSLLVSLSLFLSRFFYLSLLSLYTSLYLSFSLWLTLSLSMFLPRYLSGYIISLSLSVSIYLSINLFIYLSLLFLYASLSFPISHEHHKNLSLDWLIFVENWFSWYFDVTFSKESFLIMVLILVGNLEAGAHVQSDLGWSVYSICLDREQSQIWLFSS